MLKFECLMSDENKDEVVALGVVFCFLALAGWFGLVSVLLFFCVLAS